MLVEIDGLPENVFGLKAVGVVTKKDYVDVLIPLIEKQFLKNQKLKMIYHLGPEFKEFEYKAMWEDVKIGLKHFSQWEKVAIVTNWKSLGWFALLTGFFVPGNIRSFSNDYYEKALMWIKE
jgi:hypothetical protein